MKWKKFLFSIFKIYRAIDRGFSDVQNKKTRQDRMIIKVISGLLNLPDTKVFFLPTGVPTVYIHTKDNSCLATVTRFQVKITSSNFFFVSNIPDQMSESLINLALEKLEAHVKELQAGMAATEENFLSDIYYGLKQKPENNIPKRHPSQMDLLDGMV